MVSVANLYHDHNVAREITHSVRRAGHLVTTARDIGMDRAKDDEQLLVAAQRNWILVSHNREDFFLLHDAWRRWSRAWGVTTTHPGILVVAQMPPAWHRRIADEIVRFVELNPVLSDTLHMWRPTRGWQLRS